MLHIFARASRVRRSGLMLAALALCLLPLRVTAQPVDPFAAAWRWARFTTESGLPVNRVALVSEAADGTVWVRAQNQLARFDSYTWHTATQRWVHVQGLVAQAGGRAVVIDDGRLFEGDLQGFTLVTAGAIGRLRAIAPLADGRVALLGEGGRLLAMRGRAVEPLATPHDEPARGLLAAGRNAWVSVPSGVYRWTAGGWQLVLASGDAPVDVTAAAENADGQGVFFVSEPGAQRAVWSVDPGGIARPDRDLSRALVNGIAVAPNGDAVVACMTGELFVRRGGQWTRQPGAIAGLTNVLSLAVRPNGDLWVGSETGVNLFRGSSTRWRTWATPGTVPETAVNGIVRARDGTVWLGTGQGVGAIGRDDRLRTYATGPDGGALGAVTAVAEDAHGRIWIGSGGGFAGAYYRDGNRWRRVSSGTALDRAQVHRIAKDRRGRLWFLCLSVFTRHQTPPVASPGVFVLDGDTVIDWGTRERLPARRVYAFAEGPDGAYWFGTDRGISRWLDERWTHWTSVEGLLQGRAFTLLADDRNRLWFGDQQNGLGLIEDGTVRYFTTADGLISDAVWDLAQGADGALWIATRGGLSLRREASWASFDLASGLENTALWPVEVERDAVYVGMASGIARLGIGARTHLPVVRPLQTIVHGDTALARWKAFAFDGQTPPDRIVTRVRLDDEPWSAWSMAREATFTRLSSGPHRVTIQAGNLFGLHEAGGAVASLRVERPLVLRPAFYLPFGALVLVVLSLTGVLVVRQRRYQIALAEREARFALVSHVTRDALWDWDLADGHRCAWGEGLQVSFGYAPDETADRRDWWTERVHPEDRQEVLAGLDAALDGDAQVWSADYRFRRRDGDYATVFDRARIVRDGAGRAVRLIGAMMDVSERNELRTRLRHAQKLESIGRLAGGIAHEFNNLLTVIIGNIDLLLAETRPADPGRLELEQVRDAAGRAARLTSQMLGFARRQIIRPTVLNLNHLILDVESMLRGGVGEEVQIVTNPGPDLGLVRMDPSQVEQLLVNLAVNARDAMPGGGSLTIETRDAEVTRPPAAEPGVTPGPYVVLSVADTGVGMDEATMAHLFEPFFTTKPPGQGAGLGLATCYGIVRQNHGFMQVTSRPGSGTRFDIYLPRAPEAGEPAGAPPAGPVDRKGHGEVLLVVEDESDLRRLIVRTLRASGYDVIEAASGPDALQAVAKFRTPLTLLVTDIVMPHMAGPELAATLRARWPALRVLFISGYTDRAHIPGLDAEGARFLPKPFTPSALRRHVQEMLASARPFGDSPFAADDLRPN